MKEKDLIKKIHLLSKIRPNQNWANSVKTSLLSQEESIKVFVPARPSLTDQVLEVFQVARYIWDRKPAFATAGLIMAVGVFVLAQSALPGEPLFMVKKAGEQANYFLTPEDQLARLNLKLANDRLEDLSAMIGSKPAGNLKLALVECKEMVDQTAKIIKNAKSNLSSKEVLEQAIRLTENQDKFKILATEIGNSQEIAAIDQVLQELVSAQIKDLENRTLNDNQKEILIEAKKAMEVFDYNKALEKILILSYTK